MSEHQRILDAIGEFHRVYGHKPQFARIVGELVDALQAVDRAGSPGHSAATAAAFTATGQEPSGRAEQAAKSSPSTQVRGTTESARGGARRSARDASHSGRGRSTAQRGS